MQKPESQETEMLNTTMIKETATRRVVRATDELKAQWREMIQAEAPVLVLAAAFAVGTLVSMVPVPVVDMMIAALVMRLMHRLPRGPIMAAMAMWNSFIMAPVYATSPKVGGRVIAEASAHSVAMPDALAVQVVVGMVLIALGMALASFVLSATFFATVRRGRTATAA
jgi:hypothetical protein